MIIKLGIEIDVTICPLNPCTLFRYVNMLKDKVREALIKRMVYICIKMYFWPYKQDTEF